MATIAQRKLQYAALPITAQELVASLTKICSISSKHTLGLAVSGGVDSMALAHLASQIQTAKSFDQIPNNRLKFQAFIVDHGARDGSHEEATRVSHVLEDRGVPSKVLKIQWPLGEEPSTCPNNFESLARKQRYRLLGLACRTHSINSLLLAHHEDDQVETLLMRLMDQHRRWGLMGMASSSVIPKCHGIYGVHEAGKYLNLNSNGPENGDRPFATEDSGVKIYRPLLSFSKERLIATCEAANMPWFEDPTNKDSGLTKRNAVRHVLRTCTLPAALSKANLLAFSKRVRQQHELLERQASQWIASCSLLRYEPRSGTLGIEFSDSPFKQNKQEHEVAVRVLRRFILQVTPLEHVRLSSLHGFVEKIFPQLSGASSSRDERKAFNIASTLFLPVTCERLSTWLLSRQLPISTTSPLIRFTLTLSSGWTPWTLFDNRFWLRVRLVASPCPSYPASLSVRLFNRGDMAPLKARMDKPGRKHLEGMLRKVARGDVRWTLPVLELGIESDKIVVGLPSLDIWTGADGYRVDCQIKGNRGPLESTIASSAKLDPTL